MTPRQLNYFLQIAELRNFTRASAVLHIAQPALSRQIQQLEDELGVKLFKRTDNGVTLTDAGIALKERAVGLLDQFERVRNEVSAHASHPRGNLFVGLPPSMFDLVTVPIIEQYYQLYPDVRVKVTEGISSVLHEAVLSGRLDFAVVSSTEDLPSLEGYPLLREPLYLVGPIAQAGQISDYQVVPLELIPTLPLMATSRPNAMRLILEDALRAKGLQSNTILETTSSRLITELVVRGMGWGLLPYCAIHKLRSTGMVVTAPVESLEITWMLVHSRERDLSIPGQKFRDLLIEIAHKEISADTWLGASTFADAPDARLGASDIE